MAVNMEQRERELQQRIRGLEASRIAYASEFDGDVGSIHQNIRELKARADRLEAESARLRHAAEERWNMVECDGMTPMRDLTQEGCRFFYLRPRTALEATDDRT